MKILSTMDWFLLFAIAFFAVLIFIYFETRKSKIIDYISVPHTDNPITLKKFIEKYNQIFTKFTIKGSLCMNEVDEKTNGEIKGDDRKIYFSNKYYVNEFLQKTFGFSIDMYSVQYGEGKWRDYMEDILNIKNIIDFGSSSIKDSKGTKIKIDTLNSSIEDIQDMIKVFDKGTIIATQSMRTMRNEKYDKYCKIIEMFKMLGFDFRLLSTKEEAIYTTEDTMRKMDVVDGRYICIDIGGGSTQVTVVEY